MVRAIRKGSAVPSAHTSVASIHAVSQLPARGSPAVAATIPTGGILERPARRADLRSKQTFDGIARGMLFQFINSNVENQYEFVLRQWANDSEFAGAVRLHPRSKDPMSHRESTREHFRHTAGEWRLADRRDRSLELRHDESRCVRVSAEHHGDQIHRQLVRWPVQPPTQPRTRLTNRATAARTKWRIRRSSEDTSIEPCPIDT